MNEPLDLDALERWNDGRGDCCRYQAGLRIQELITELRATRAERDAAKWDFLAALADRKDETARAERAEESVRLAHITCDKLQAESLGRRARAERAEAAIARVEAACSLGEAEAAAYNGTAILHPEEIRAALRGEK